MKRVLLTGATGFVGANLARRLLHDGHDVHLIVRPSSNLWRVSEIQQHVTLHAVSLEDSASVEQTVRDCRPEWIFHLAAHGAYSWQKNIRQMIDTNIVGTVNLVESCLKADFESFIQAGSSSEYGFKDHAPGEDDCLEPNSHYAVTKATATHYGRHMARSLNVRISTLRLYSVFGPYEDPGRLIPTLIMSGLEGRLPPLVDPTIARDYVHSDDVSEAFLLAAGSCVREPDAIYNVGSGLQTSLQEVVDIAREVLQIEELPQWGSMPNRSWDSSCWVADNRKIKQELGWQPRLSFQQGFQSLIDWMRHTPLRASKYADALTVAG
jgi:UDP-glucose 4-epimerase